MTRESVDAKAQRYLTEGRVRILHVNDGGAHALVRGAGHLYTVDARPGTWRCTCPARRRCAHIAALELVVAFSEDVAS